MNPKISVVIPVYNAEKYLEACVQSLINQTFRDFEIILVDDGSTDRSIELCNILQKKEKIIRVIQKAHSGPSETRNTGTEASSGDYITYIDSDDTVHSDYLKILFSLVEEYDADISTCEFLFCKEGEIPRYSEGVYENGLLTGMESLKRILQGRIHSTSACGLLINRKLAEAFRFPVGKYHEDDLTTYKYFMNADKVAYTKRALYTYYQRLGSIMHKPFSQIDVDELDAADLLYEDCKSLGQEYEKAALVKKTENYLQILFKFSDFKKNNHEVYLRIMTFINSRLVDILTNKYISKRTKINIVLYKVNLLFAVKKIKTKIKKIFAKNTHNRN